MNDTRSDDELKLIWTAWCLTIGAIVLFGLLCPKIPKEKRDPIWIEIRGTNVIIRDLPGFDEGYTHIIRINGIRMGFNVHGCSVGSLSIGSKQPISE